MPENLVSYKCLIISPGDVAEDRATIAAALHTWNSQIGRALACQVTPLLWETHGVPDASGPAQQVLNQQIVDEADFGIAAFWSRLGTPTETHRSSSLEEIDRLVTRGARVLIYFSAATLPPDLDLQQYQDLQAFKGRMRERALLGNYTDIANLREQVLLHVTAVVAALLPRTRGLPAIGESEDDVRRVQRSMRLPEPLVLEYINGVPPYEELWIGVDGNQHTALEAPSGSPGPWTDPWTQRMCAVRVFNPNDVVVTGVRITASLDPVTDGLADVPLHLRHDEPTRTGAFTLEFNLGPKTDRIVDVLFGNSKADTVMLYHVVGHLSQRLTRSPVDVLVKASSETVHPSKLKLRAAFGREPHKLRVFNLG